MTPVPLMRRDVQAVVLAKLARLDVSRAASALTDPAVALETVTFAAAPAAALASAVLLYSRRRGAWIRREFSSHINVALVGFRASRASGKPTLVLRTISEQRLDAIIDNEHGRSELARAAKQQAFRAARPAGRSSLDEWERSRVSLIHMPTSRSAGLVANTLLNSVSAQFALGALQRDAGIPGVVCRRYGLGLACGEGAAGGTKLRAFLASEESLQLAVDLAASGTKPQVEVLAHYGAYLALLRLGSALGVDPSPAAEAVVASEGEADGAGKGAAGTPIATWLELCVPAAQ